MRASGTAAKVRIFTCPAMMALNTFALEKRIIFPSWPNPLHPVAIRSISDRLLMMATTKERRPSRAFDYQKGNLPLPAINP